MRDNFVIMPVLITVCLIVSAFVPVVPGLFLSLDGALISFVNNHLFSGRVSNFNALQMGINGAMAFGGLLLFYVAKTRVSGYLFLLIATFFLYSFLRFTFYPGYELDLTRADFLELALLAGVMLALAGILKSKIYLGTGMKKPVPFS